MEEGVGGCKKSSLLVIPGIWILRRSSLGDYGNPILL